MLEKHATKHAKTLQFLYIVFTYELLFLILKIENKYIFRNEKLKKEI